jgi:deoxyribodipyrimidine photolyase-related protein
MQKFSILRLILGDQLNGQNSWFEATRDEVLYVMMELRSETDYVQHHVQKVLGFFAAMRIFADELRTKGHRIHYFKLDDPDNQQTFADNCQALIEQHQIQHFEYQLPDEWRLDEHLKAFCQNLDIAHRVLDTEHFYSTRDELATQFQGKKTYLMEAFYRKMREKHQVLMEADGKTPLTGQWNYDAENRKKLPKGFVVPAYKVFTRDLSDLYQLIQDQGIICIGKVDPKHFDWPLTHTDSLDLLQHFVQIRLSHFGDYQDALSNEHWLLFHSRLSFSMNVKLISPQEVVDAAIAFWQKQPQLVPYSALEGFVRQIIGWREYMRGVYWAKMPAYRDLNYFDHQLPLPAWYWTGETKLNCLQKAITQSLERAYAHHIQRLMVTGNFALLLGVHPDEVDAWYLGIYMDAIEWVEITNTRGMSQFADGGIVGTKPYVSSANYIHKMGDHCSQCHYDRSLRHGPRACPFNSLYWDFYDRHRDKLKPNPRIGMAYQLWDKMDPEEQAKTLEQAAFYKNMVNQL